MFGKSWTRVSSWLRKAENRDKAGQALLVALIYLVLAFGAAVASILWRIV